MQDILFLNGRGTMGFYSKNTYRQTDGMFRPMFLRYKFDPRNNHTKHVRRVLRHPVCVRQTNFTDTKHIECTLLYRIAGDLSVYFDCLSVRDFYYKTNIFLTTTKLIEYLVKKCSSW